VPGAWQLSINANTKEVLTIEAILGDLRTVTLSVVINVI
jgi:hypothetical protein